MKRLLFTTIMAFAATFVFAQNTSSDSSKTKSDSSRNYHISFGGNDENSDWHGSRHHHQHKSLPGFNAGITFSRFDLGLATLVDNGSFTLSPKNQFLDYRSWKTSTVGFDVIQFGYRFGDNFKINLSGGFDWTLIRLEKNETILRDQPTLVAHPDSGINYSKNRFSASYLRIPLSFDIRSSEDSHGKRAHFVFGPEAGILLGGMVKQISPEFGKKKFYDDYHFAKVRYGAFARLGYDGWGFFAKYYVNDMFENSPNQAGLKNFSFGLMFGF